MMQIYEKIFRQKDKKQKVGRRFGSGCKSRVERGGRMTCDMSNIVDVNTKSRIERGGLDEAGVAEGGFAHEFGAAAFGFATLCAS